MVKRDEDVALLPLHIIYGKKVVFVLSLKYGLRNLRQVLTGFVFTNINFILAKRIKQEKLERRDCHLRHPKGRH